MMKLLLYLLSATSFLALSLPLHAKWKSIGGPPAADVRVITMIHNTILIGTPNGVFSSHDSGAHWEWSSKDIGNTAVSALQTIGETVYAGTDSGSLYSSTDRGFTWTLTTFPKYSRITAIARWRGDLYIAAASDILKSNDNAATWTHCDSGLSGYGILSFHASEDSTGNARPVLLVGESYGGAWYSQNGGKSWRRFNTSVWDNQNLSIPLVHANKGKWFVYAVGAGIFATTNEGNTWRSSSTGLVQTSTTAIGSAEDTLYCETIGSGMYKSTDNGNFWFSSDLGLARCFAQSLFVQGNFIIAGAARAEIGGPTYAPDDGVYISTDAGASWRQRNGLGLINCSVYDFAVSDGILYCAGTYDGIYASTDLGKHWDRPLGGLLLNYVDRLLPISASNGTHILLANFTSPTSLSQDENDLWRLPTHDSTWSPSDSGLSGRNVVHEFAVDSSGGLTWPRIYAVTVQGVYRSTNGGKSWFRGDSSLRGNLTKPIAVMPSSGSGNPGKIFVGTTNGLYYSTDGTLSWHKTVSNLRGLFVKSLVVHRNLLFALTDSGLFSTPDGLTFTRLSVPLAPSLFSLYSVDSLLFGAGAGAIVVSNDNGLHWRTAIEGFSDKEIFALQKIDSLVLIGTYGLGVWARSYKEFLDSTSDVTPLKNSLMFDIGAPFPCPVNANSSGIITINNLNGILENARLDIFDERGYKTNVRSIVYDRAGQNNIELDVSQLPAGTYFYRFTKQQNSWSGKFVIAR